MGKRIVNQLLDNRETLFGVTDTPPGRPFFALFS
jgi:hypothetical protein